MNAKNDNSNFSNRATANMGHAPTGYPNPGFPSGGRIDDSPQSPGYVPNRPIIPRMHPDDLAAIASLVIQMGNPMIMSKEVNFTAKNPIPEKTKEESVSEKVAEELFNCCLGYGLGTRWQHNAVHIFREKMVAYWHRLLEEEKGQIAQQNDYADTRISDLREAIRMEESSNDQC